MASGGQRRTRSERVAALELPPGQWERAWIGLRRRDLLGRVALALAAATAIAVMMRAWDPPMIWRAGQVLPRFVTARVTFQQEDVAATKLARDRARNNVRIVFSQDRQPLEQLRAMLRTTIADLTKAETLTDSGRGLWREFQPPTAKRAAAPKPSADDARFREFRTALAGKENLDQLERVVAEAFAPLEKYGVLGTPREQLQSGNQEEIVVYPAGSPTRQEIVKVSDVLLDKDKSDALRSTLREKLHSTEVADHVFAWLQFHLLHPEPLSTLTKDQAATAAAQDEAAENVEPVFQRFNAGETIVIPGEQIGEKQLELLKLEYQAFVASRPLAKRIACGGAVLIIVFALFILCGVYMRYRQRGPLASLGRLIGMLLLAVGTVALSLAAASDPWRAELLPLVLFSMTMAIVYRQELALLLSGVLALIIALGLGHGLPLFLLLFGTMAAAALTLGRIRSRTKLIYVGLLAGGVAALLDLAMNMINNQPLGLPLWEDVARQWLWAVAAGFVITGLLPFIEKIFGILTDLSLLELGDITHPLLQELVRRAPSTYNHSITVGSIAEAAAEAIGARGLLVRVGAYFHDIGKMLKPGYFVENQGSEGSLHQSLVPAMSTLVIIAHIKDGADLARQHRLPQPIIDLVMQHHGTMLMEYFYDRAYEKKGSDPNGGEVDETLFHYPGPKPQTKEAAVLMLADAVESASRTLVDPTPARIESLVRDLAQRRLQAGQFDESGLTLRELGTIERSLVMSVASIYHGRLKYPEPRTA
ncbi:MAG: HDIG domain-containing metalloprotein [Thermoguttaceae bacterium]|jgi:putative nucleotidyltransferase with HDIG domain